MEQEELRGRTRRPASRGVGVVTTGRFLGVWPGWCHGVDPPGHAHLAGGRGPGLLLLTALIGYTVKNAWKDDVFFSWSYFLGWLALPFYILAGNLDSREEG